METAPSEAAGCGKRIKCRMTSFYETQIHGPTDQKFDEIWKNTYLRILTFGN